MSEVAQTAPTPPVSSRTNFFAKPFPKWALVPWNGGRMSVRAGALAEFMLSRLRVSKLNFSARPVSDVHYVSMTSREHWLLLRESLLSLARAWVSVPRLTIISDGSWVAAEFQQAFRFWDAPIRVVMPEEIFAWLEAEKLSALRVLAQQHSLNLKLGGILFLAKTAGPILFMDSDILWFADPSVHLATLRGTSGPSASFEDGGSFNDALAIRFGLDPKARPATNSGSVYLDGELCDRALLDDLLTAAAQQPGHRFNEQTIVAILVAKVGRWLPPAICLVEFNDAFAWCQRLPLKEGYCSRHYVGFMRHQFYRNAVFLNK